MALNSDIMNTDDIMHGSGGSALLEVGENRYNLFTIKKFEGKVTINKREKGLLGSPKKANYTSGWKGTFTATIEFNTSTFQRMVQVYKDTGVFPAFKIQTTNENFSGSTGRQQVIYSGCVLDELPLSMFDTESDGGLEMNISGTFEDFEIPEGFTDMPGYRLA